MLAEAECDFKDWLRGDRPSRLSQIETLEALYGLSSALCRMHQYSLEGQEPSMIGCYFDLHPGNILVRGISFILFDFGLSRLKYEREGSKSYFKGGIRDYCAPECQRWEDDFDANRPGRPSDVWSFGCIVAEVITFLKYGAEGLRRFDKVRRVHGTVPTLRTFHDRGRPHQGVASWMGELSNERFERAIVAGLANLVSRMLTTQLSLLCLNMRYHETTQSLQHLIPTADTEQ